MKRIISLLVLLLISPLIQNTLFSQDAAAPLTEEEISDNTQKLILTLRENVEKKNYKEAFSSLYSAMKNKTVISTWFFYVMLAESAKNSGNFGTAIHFIPNNGRLKIFKKTLNLWAAGDNMTAAKLLATISQVDPSLEYLVGKLYMISGKLYQGAGYLYLGSDMKEAPYGLYYAGLGQNAVGKFSDAYSFLSQAQRNLLESEAELNINIQIQMAIAEFGRENYSHAYELIMPIYEKRPVDVLKMMDPGLILTGMEKNFEAKAFWEKALKQKLPYAVSTQIKKNLTYNKRLVDPNYPPAWMRR